MSNDQLHQEITGEMTIGQVFTHYPSTKPVIEKYFHGGCHHCPSQHTEPLWLAAKLYAVSLDQLLAELSEAAGLTSKCDVQISEPASLIVQTPTERRLARDRARGLNY